MFPPKKEIRFRRELFFLVGFFFIEMHWLAIYYKARINKNFDYSAIRVIGTKILMGYATEITSEH